jgi:uncharacterized protein YpmB
MRRRYSGNASSQLCALRRFCYNIGDSTGGFITMKTKVTLILLAILAATGLIVFLLMQGVGHRDQAGEELIPSDSAAKAYVLQSKLLTTVTEIKRARPGGPVFKLVAGKDDAGNDKVVWLTGKDKSIMTKGTALLKDGVPRDQIVAKASAKGITPDQTLDMYVVPHDYESSKIVWFVQDKSDKKHMLWFDFKTGELMWEAYQDPTAWKLGG